MRRPHLCILKSDLHSAATHCLKGVLEGGSQHSPLRLWEACDAAGDNVLASSPKLPQHHKERASGVVVARRVVLSQLERAQQGRQPARYCRLPSGGGMWHHVEGVQQAWT